MSSEVAPLGAKEKVFLILIVPLILLIGLEVLCRIVGLPKLLSPPQNNLVLEMPTWMQNDSNALTRASRMSVDPKQIDWLNLFKSGDGFRVNLIPNIERWVTNTFSLIPYDRDHKYFIKSNSLGFRSKEPSRTSESIRVLVFGDSSSFGWGVNQDEMFSTLIEERLSKELNKPVEVLNFAIPGDSSEYGRLIFEKFAKSYKPTYVILGFGANDAKMVYSPHVDEVARFKSNNSLLSIVSLLRYSSIVESLEALSLRLKNRTNQEKPARKTKKVAVPKKRYQENLRFMAEESKRLGAEDVLILNLCTPGNYAKRAKVVSERYGFLYLNGQQKLIDLLPDIKGGKYYPETLASMMSNYGRELNKNQIFYVTSDSCHPNSLGHSIVADQIVTILTRNS